MEIPPQTPSVILRYRRRLHKVYLKYITQATGRGERKVIIPQGRKIVQ
jgi:hypothetical protein